MTRTGRAPSAGCPAAARRTRDHIVPLLEERPGLRGYCAFVTGQGGATCSVGVFDDSDTAMDAHRRVEERVDANMNDLVPEAPEVVAGETVFDSIAHPWEQMRDRQRPLFVVARTHHGLPGAGRGHGLRAGPAHDPAVVDAPGFRGLCTSRDEADPDRAVSVSLSDGRWDAVRWHERVVGAAREELGEMACWAPEAAMGGTAVLSAA